MRESVPFRPLPVDLSDVVYAPGPDSMVRPGVPRGRTTEHVVTAPRAFPDTTRKVWVHAPARPPAEPLPFVVFQDGAGYLDPDDDVRATIVLDNLIHDGAVPPMVGVFVEPVRRNLEYDAFDSRYADLLVDDVLPMVAEQVRLHDDPAQRAICGHSSGGNAALTAAWHRPDAFGNVIGFVSSFAQIPGGNPYPSLVATEPSRPLRIFLQTAHRDLGWDEPDDNWLAANLEVTAALVRRGYDVRLVLGDGGHSPQHAGVLLPDAIRWIWRDRARQRKVSFPE